MSPALGLLFAGSFLPLLLNSSAISTDQFRQLAFLATGSPSDRRPGDAAAAPRLWAPLLVARRGRVLVVGWAAFNMNPLVTLVGLVLALLLAKRLGARETGRDRL